VNLIALNSGPEIPFQTPSAQAVERFQRELIAAGIPAYVRRPRGLDIYAACGQLKRTTGLISIE
jgi:23S rRNA (adenine2503-C2)-methyltransferase